jgi:hypothetical protein
MAAPALRVVPSQQAVPVWPDANDAADLLAIVEDQAGTMAANAILVDRYQSALNNARSNSATATGTAAGTALTVTGAAGTIAIGSAVSGPGIPGGTTILNQVSGTTGGSGVYTTSVATVANASPLTFTPAPPALAAGTGTTTGASAAVVMSNVSGTIQLNSTVSGGPGIPASPPTTVIAQTAGTAGQNGTYTFSQPVTLTNAALAFTPPAQAVPWPTPRDAPTLMTVSQNQAAVLRTQAALLSHYQDVLNSSQTPAV